ncbi:hypothetical protein E4100_06480 [Soehngenia longivitae]|uniref:Flagellar protein FlgN n=1 Tax=Soehngenia longivitae TaxID=2562294 RepID=A0A4Z0D5D1_9FIRM|nr:hypothetical protein [Soehngenia longivitae]TFZ39904.1 hypothetical protein E4100_06480 [Soehngenia longivitae]
MNSFKEITKILENLKKILLIEKDALINDKANIIESVLDEKTKLINELGLYDITNIETDIEVKNLIFEVLELQKTNQMLTKQALSYQKNLMENIAKVLSKGNTYKKNGLEKQDISTFIDETV